MEARCCKVLEISGRCLTKLQARFSRLEYLRFAIARSWKACLIRTEDSVVCDAGGKPEIFNCIADQDLDRTFLRTSSAIRIASLGSKGSSR